MNRFPQSEIQSSGYSSTVRGWLVVGGERHALAQVGPDFCVLKSSESFPVSLPSSPAELIVEVDGDVQRADVILECVRGEATRIGLVKFEIA